MQTPWLNTLGNWNPQFLRECRGRLKPRSILATITLSMLMQMLLFLNYWQRAQWLEDRAVDWLGLWVNMSWFIAYGLIVIGSYFLINDINQEDRLGTLNFIRLSPRPSQEILLGKLLGVPILPYLGVVLAMPLHVIAGVLGAIPLAILISFYGMLLAGAIFFFSLALLFGLLSGSGRVITGQQSAAALVFVMLLLLLGLPSYMSWNFQSVWRSLPGVSFPWQEGVQWMFLPVQTHIGLAHGFTLLTLAIGTIFIWRMLLRRFLIPRATVMSKPMSYALVAYLEVWILGFTLNRTLASLRQVSTNLVLLYLFNFGLFLVLMFVLCPGRQEVLDWLRFRTAHRGENVVEDAAPVERLEALTMPGVWRDLVWADGSPSIVAIALNLLIANALNVPWVFLLGPGQNNPAFVCLAIMSVSAVILIEAAAVQWTFTAPIRNPGTWATGILAIWLIVPVTVVHILALTPDRFPPAMILLTVLGYPFVNTAQPLTSYMIIGVALQCLLLIWLGIQLRKRLRQLTANLSLRG